LYFCLSDRREKDDTFVPQAIPPGHGMLVPAYGYPTMDEYAHGWLAIIHTAVILSTFT